VSFAAPALLAGLLALPALVLALVAARRRRHRYPVRFPGTATVAAVAAADRLGVLRRTLPAALMLLALAALVIAVARPQTTVAVPDERATAILVTDVSRSMLAEDVDPDRMTAAKAAARTFLERVPDRLRVGAVAFSDTPRTLQSPTLERDRLGEQIDGLVADGGTATGDALTAALELVGETPGDGDDPDRQGSPPAAIVLLSDGAATTGSDPFAAADAAGDADVPIYTVSLGTASATVPAPDGSGLRIPADPDPASLRAIADRSGGRAFDADSAAALDAVYEELGSQLGTREEKREITAAFAAGGAVLLLGSFALSLLWGGRLP
jgi:Ca-activated chloride channel family protein